MQTKTGIEPGNDLEEYAYNLPADQIAQTPLADRAQARLLVLDRRSGRIDHSHFYELNRYIDPGDVLVVNDTRVTSIRLFGARRGHSSERAETFLTHKVSVGLWNALVRPGRKLLPGVVLDYGGGLIGEILETTDARGGRLIRLVRDGEPATDDLLEARGEVPLPPYITKPLARDQKDLYQTVYAQHDGSAAAPTAGLHFTPDLLSAVVSRGALIARVTLHVGTGTFRPIETSDIREHSMHSERITVTKEAAEIINGATGRIIAVGTTSARALESAAVARRRIEPLDGQTSLYITPGFPFQIVDSLITNFHMPRSTLLVLVSAFSGIEQIRNAYREALSAGYRFLSFGDAMLIR